MSWSSGEGVEIRASFGVGYKVPVDLSVGREHRGAYLVLGNHVAEIRLERVHLDTIEEQLPGVLADLDVLDCADKRAADAGSRAMERAAHLLDQAIAAELAHEHERARTLRETADRLTAATKVLETALAGVEDAALDADRAAEDAQRLLEQRVVDEQPVQEQPAEELRINGHPVDAA